MEIWINNVTQCKTPNAVDVFQTHTHTHMTHAQTNGSCSYIMKRSMNKVCWNRHPNLHNECGAVSVNKLKLLKDIFSLCLLLIISSIEVCEQTNERLPVGECLFFSLQTDKLQGTVSIEMTINKNFESIHFSEQTFLYVENIDLDHWICIFCLFQYLNVTWNETKLRRVIFFDVVLFLKLISICFIYRCY